VMKRWAILLCLSARFDGAAEAALAKAAGRKGTSAPRPVRQAQGFGTPAAAPAKAVKRWADGPADPRLEELLLRLEARGASIVDFLNPALVDYPRTLDDAARRLRAGEVVVLRDAFREEFAEAAYRELSSKSVPWSLNEQYYEDGYAHCHMNVYDRALFSERMNKTFDVFASDATKAWIGELTQRDCSGVCTGAPSYYRAGDHSLPHTDWVGQRTVAYVWHLSKKWKPEWGGALYWAENHHSKATFPASFNSLVLFRVTTTSAHFVTTVSPHAKQQRLAYNGWWQSSWVPQANEEFDEVLMNEEKSSCLTHTQLQTITDLLSDPWQNIEPERKDTLEQRRKQVMDELFPP